MTIPTNLMIQAVNEFERCGRLIAAGLGLVKLRERYETWWRDDLPPDERTWRDYTAKHMRFGTERAQELLGRMTGMHQHRWPDVRRSSSVAVIEPTALDRALAALAAHPERSNRAIAAEISLSEATVRRARQKLAAGS